MASVTAADFQQTRYFDHLDGLRALAAVAVVMFHVKTGLFEFMHGDRGVPVFFVMSGFLITTLALREEARRGAFSYGGFFVRRVFRILPLYYLALATYGVLVLSGFNDQRSEFIEALPYYLFYFQEYPGFTQPDVEWPFSVAWSLGIEEKFYVVWPLLGFVLMHRTRYRAGVLLAAAVLPVAVHMSIDGTVRHFFLPYAQIAAGALMAVALNHRRVFERVASVVRWDWMVWATTLLVAGLMLVDGPPTYMNTVWFPLAVAAWLLTLTMRAGTPVHRFLTLRPVVAVGRVSYGVYLFHVLGLNLAEKVVPESMGKAGGVPIFLIGLGVTLVACFALHRWFEQPLIEYGRRRAARRPAPTLPGEPDAAAAAAG